MVKMYMIEGGEESEGSLGSIQIAESYATTRVLSTWNESPSSSSAKSSGS